MNGGAYLFVSQHVTTTAEKKKNLKEKKLQHLLQEIRDNVPQSKQDKNNNYHNKNHNGKKFHETKS